MKKRTKSPPTQSPAPDDWLHFWDGEAAPLVEEAMRKRTQAVRVAKERAALSIKARQGSRADRNQRIRAAAAKGKAPKVIAAAEGIDVSTVNRILKAAKT